MSPEEARRRALIKLGGVTLTQELYGEQRGLPTRPSPHTIGISTLSSRRTAANRSRECLSPKNISA
jgi:hypothetical protein